MVGIIMAVYPLAALVTTPVAARFSRRSVRIVTVHSFSLLAVSAAMLLTSLAGWIQKAFGSTYGVAWIVLGRVVQGAGASLFLSSNTSLLARRFPDKLPYVIGLTEVAVGAGSQIGRICGGFLFDYCGFVGPFFGIGLIQFVIGCFGMGFEDASANVPSDVKDALLQNPDSPKHSTTLPWSELVTPRMCVGAMGAFLMYFVGCFGDATLLQYLSMHLAPISVGGMNVILCSRGLSYLLSSFFVAQVMRHQLVSFERLILCGSLLTMLSQLLIAPQPFIIQVEGQLFANNSVSRGSLISTEIVAFIINMIGHSMIFVPGLPLMQAEVRRHGNSAVEQVAELFVALLTLGEMLGPLVGGWLVGQVGFVRATLLLSFVCIPHAILAFVTYDSKVVKARRIVERRADMEQNKEARPGVSDGCTCNMQMKGVLLSDGEASFAWRRIPFALDVKRSRRKDAMSAPSAVFRRKYDPSSGGVEQGKEVCASLPAEAFHRSYQPPSHTHNNERGAFDRQVTR
eukprot:TRINITY_DN23954_c0_g1_i1.p1 TRINITY_DN23954_c0_g1~~TRINITY_DN23954_c0_g1_i1.p1  ORF type:complete len:597 (-),score=78.07 TRINITY_DN23954_c0_g1_i1:108-1646(-)